MSESDKHMHLSRRNGAAAEIALREQDAIIRAQQIRIDGLLNSISSLNERVTALETANAMRRVSELGRGPTVK